MKYKYMFESKKIFYLLFLFVLSQITIMIIGITNLLMYIFLLYRESNKMLVYSNMKITKIYKIE